MTQFCIGHSQFTITAAVQFNARYCIKHLFLAMTSDISLFVTVIHTHRANIAETISMPKKPNYRATFSIPIHPTSIFQSILSNKISKNPVKIMVNSQSAQEERESLLRKQEELTAELKQLRAAADASSSEVERLTKRTHILESTIDAANSERKLLDLELAESKQESAERSIEISRLATLLDNARAKIEELEQSRQLETKSEADEMLDAARREKDTLETQAAALQEQLARSHCDHDRLRDQHSQLQEEFKVRVVWLLLGVISLAGVSTSSVTLRCCVLYFGMDLGCWTGLKVFLLRGIESSTEN